jgi:hypothetical protein
MHTCMRSAGISTAGRFVLTKKFNWVVCGLPLDVDSRWREGHFEKRAWAVREDGAQDRVWLGETSIKLYCPLCYDSVDAKVSKD